MDLIKCMRKGNGRHRVCIESSHKSAYSYRTGPSWYTTHLSCAQRKLPPARVSATPPSDTPDTRRDRDNHAMWMSLRSPDVFAAEEG